MTPEFTSAPHGLAQWLICFGAILWIANQAMSLSKKLRGPEASPPNSSLDLSHKDLKDRVDRIEVCMAKNKTEIETKFTEMWTTMRAEDSRLAHELTQFAVTLNRAVGQLQGAIKERSQHNTDNF